MNMICDDIILVLSRVNPNGYDITHVKFGSVGLSLKIFKVHILSKLCNMSEGVTP
jgi:hypothetical protein